MKREEFKSPRYIFAEGFEDSAFATAVLRNRNPKLPSPTESDPVNNLGEAAGKDGFYEAILAADSKRGFDDVSQILILADNDGDPNGAFQSICKQIERANSEGLNRKWPVPAKPGERADDAGCPSVSIWMWPEPGTRGCLETLLWRVIKAKTPDKATCIEKALTCMEANQWPVQKQDKARVRSYLALHHQRNPVIRFDVLWRDAPQLVPIDHREFSSFVDFLRHIAFK
jgi:hypothetical protein